MERTDWASPRPSRKSDTTVARETLNGDWGSGRERDILLTEAGYDPETIQTIRAELRSRTE